jgi:phosphatidylglycerol:prolipoprotein diacylglycerol transferase
MNQVLFRIPIYLPDWAPDGIPIYGFGMMLFLTFVVTTWMAGRRAQQEGIGKEVIQDLAIWVFVGGIVGARLTFLIAYDLPLWQFFRIWDGGLIFYGSVLGGLVGYIPAYFYVIRKHRVSTWKLADVIAPSVAVGLLLGRIGCLLNGCCYGAVACASCPSVSFPLSAAPRFDLVRAGYQTAAGFTVSPEEPVRVGVVEPGSAAEASGLRPGDLIVAADGHAVKSYADLAVYLGHAAAWPRGKADLSLTVVHPGQNQPATLPPIAPRTLGLHPTQLYESISMAFLFFLLTAYLPFRRHDGELTALLMIGYGVHRYLNELLRIDARPLALESNVSLFLVGAGLVLGLWLWRQPAQYQPVKVA